MSYNNSNNSNSGSLTHSMRSRLSGGSFKGRLTGPVSWSSAKERYASGDREREEARRRQRQQNQDANHPPPPPRSPTGLNRIASSASNFQSYASRYLDSIRRPRSWGNRNSGNSGRGSANSLSPPSLNLGGDLSAESSRSESPLGNVPQLVHFRAPNRLSPLPSHSGSGSGGISSTGWSGANRSNSQPSQARSEGNNTLKRGLQGSFQGVKY